MDKSIFIHPEQADCEVFFTNSKLEWSKDILFKTKRVGKIAYDGEGNILKQENWFPVFVSNKELCQHPISLKDLRRDFRNSHF